MALLKLSAYNLKDLSSWNLKAFNSSKVFIAVHTTVWA